MARSLVRSLELFGVSFPAETSYSIRDFWGTYFRHFLASNMAKNIKKLTRVVGISFTNDLNTILTHENGGIAKNWLIFTNTGFFFCISFEGYKPAEIILSESQIKVSFLDETGTLSLEVSAEFLTKKMKKYSIYFHSHEESRSFDSDKKNPDSLCNFQCSTLGQNWNENWNGYGWLDPTLEGSKKEMQPIRRIE